MNHYPNTQDIFLDIRFIFKQFLKKCRRTSHIAMESHDVYPPSEDVLLGMRDGGYLSPVRRFFCLLGTFDFLFTVLLWTLCVILVKSQQQSIPAALEAEILQYSLYSSIFDIVMCAGCRFTILILFYALLRCHHWFPVAFTTTVTCVFLLAKTFLFDWNQYQNATYPVMLVLSSFILSWSEAWFLDFRVVPQERQAAMYLSRYHQGLGGSRGVIPWLSESVSQIARGAPITHSYPESVANFYSPLESPVPSDEENENSETESMEKKLSKTRGDTPEAKMWLQQGPVIAEELLNRIHSSGWVLEKSSDVGDNVFYQKAHHKIFMISGILPVPPEAVVMELFNNFESMPNWNPSVIQCQILQKIDAKTDVTYQVSRSGGPVSSRDFVTLRHLKLNQDGTQVLAAVSVKHTTKPANQPKLIRGTNGIGGWVINACSGEPNRAEYQWVLDVDLRLQGWVPKSVVDSAMVSAALDTIKFLRQKLVFLPVDVIPPAVAIQIHTKPNNENNPTGTDAASSSAYSA